MSLTAVFFGTPEFAVPSLERVLESGTRVCLAVTQPDRPVGRHSTPRASEIARVAGTHGIPTVKPGRVRQNQDLLAAVRSCAPDVGIVVAYGRILPPELLEIPRLGFVNVHASLLPRHRGASPVQAALLAGDRETGVVTMRVESELDAGPVYLKRSTAIGEREDAGSLSRRLAGSGADLLVETLAGLENATLSPRPQEGPASFCRPIRRDEGRIDWTLPADEIGLRLRAFTPWPGVYTFLGEERIKIHGLEPGPPTTRPAGTLWVEEQRPLVAAGGGTSLALTSVQREGRQIVSGAEFARSLRSLPATLA